MNKSKYYSSNEQTIQLVIHTDLSRDYYTIYCIVFMYNV